MTESLIRGLVAAQMAETVADYPLTDNPYQHTTVQNNSDQHQTEGNGNGWPYEVKDDGLFWDILLAGRGDARGVWQFEAALSEWIARVPGLFWTAGAESHA